MCNTDRLTETCYTDLVRQIIPMSSVMLLALAWRCPHLANTSSMSICRQCLAHIADISPKSHPYLAFLSFMSRLHFACISLVSRSYLAYISLVSRLYLANISPTFRSCVGQTYKNEYDQNKWSDTPAQGQQKWSKISGAFSLGKMIGGVGKIGDTLADGAGKLSVVLTSISHTHLAHISLISRPCLAPTLLIFRP